MNADTDDSFVTDSLWERGVDGTTLVAGSPTTFFRVTSGGAHVLDALEERRPLPLGHHRLTSRLLTAGAIHPEPRVPAPAHEVTVVIPVLARTSSDLRRTRILVDSLSPLRTIVVDDGSPLSVSEAMSAPVQPRVGVATPPGLPGDARVSVVTLDSNGGPAVARNAGLDRVETPVVVFVDSDAVISVDSLLMMVGPIVRTGTAIVAPRIQTAEDISVFAAYERMRSPLDMGPLPALVTSGSRVPYVPATVLACDTVSLRSVGGFDATMRTGEDVDLVWRMTQAGNTCRYLPSVAATHRSRESIRQFIAQRYGYGLSAAMLAQRHHGRVAPYRGNVFVALPALLLLSLYPIAAVASALMAGSWLAFRLRFARLSPLRTVALALRTLGDSTKMLTRAIRREWSPVVLIASPFSTRAAIAMLCSYLVPLLVLVVRQRPRRVVSGAALSVVDDLSYGAGVWAGAITRRNFSCLLPRLGIGRRPRSSRPV